MSISNLTFQTVKDAALNSLPFPIKLIHKEVPFFKEQIFSPRHNVSREKWYYLHTDEEIASRYFAWRLPKHATPSTPQGTPQPYKKGIELRLSRRWEAIENLGKELNLKKIYYYLHIPQTRNAEEPLYQSRGFRWISPLLIYCPADEKAQPSSEHKGPSSTTDQNKVASEEAHRFSIMHNLIGIQRNQSLWKAFYLLGICAVNAGTWYLGNRYIPLRLPYKLAATWVAAGVAHKCAVSLYQFLIRRDVYQTDKQTMEFYRSYKSSSVEKCLNFSSPTQTTYKTERVKEVALEFLERFAPEASLEFPSKEDRTAKIKEWAKKDL